MKTSPEFCGYCDHLKECCQCVTLPVNHKQRATLDFTFEKLEDDPEHFRFGFTWKFEHMEIPVAFGRN